MKKSLPFIFLMLLNIVINYYIYYWSFGMQAGPLISDEQAFDIGMLMLKTTLPAFAVSSIVIVCLTYWLLVKTKK
ncbi:hypothetical protein [Photobacterium profundum]|uniref:hypothetical protein n=1 Tax=Photobacterium profundum TaxID=74109 RepID=UPI00059E867C|nr:hypothetical protein [Photobacterium profundum]